MEKKTLLATRPSFELTTKYISSWASKVLESAREKGVVVFDLEKEKATRGQLETTIKEQSPDFIFLFDEKQKNSPLQDEIAELFLSPSNQVMFSLLENKTPQQANEDSNKFA